MNTPVSAPQPHNLTARAARWSARHPWRVILGWLAFVVVAFAIGSAAGTVQMTSSDAALGDSGAADRILAREFPNQRSLEEVLFQNRSGGRLERAELQAAVGDLVARLRRLPAVAQVRSPLDDGQRQPDLQGRPLGARRRSRSPATPTTRSTRVDRALAATAAAQQAHPALRIEEFGDASADKALERARRPGLPAGRVHVAADDAAILVVAFGALVAAGLPLLLGAHRGGRGARAWSRCPASLPVDDAITSVILLIGLAVGVDYSLFYLRREREERGRGAERADGARRSAAATSGRAVLVSGADRDDRHGRHVPDRQPDVHRRSATGTMIVVGDRDARLAHRAAGAAVVLGDRVDRGRVPFLRRLRRPSGGRAARLAAAARPRPAPSGRLRRLAARASSSRWPCPRSACTLVDPGIDSLPRDCRDADLRPHPGRLPRRPHPGRGRRPGRRRAAPAVTAGDRRAAAARRCVQAAWAGRSTVDAVAAGHDGAASTSRSPATGTDAASERRARRRSASTVIPATVGARPRRRGRTSPA